MPQLWPYKPLTGLTEVWEYRTDVLRSHDSEQRIALRPSARRMFEINNVLDSYQYASAQEIIRRFEDFYIPDWTQRQVVSVAAGSDVLIDFDASCFDFGDLAVLWRAPGAYEVIDVTAYSSTGLVANIASAWTNVYLMPCWPAVLPDGMQNSRITKQYATVRTAFEITEQFNSPESGYPQYRGIDVMTDCPLLAGGLSEQLAWPFERIDNDTGQVLILRDRGYPDATFTLRWRLKTQCSQQAMRRWLDSRLGRQKAFWISSRGQDFTLGTAIGASDTQILIGALIGVLPLARTDFDIEILITAGTVIRRRITGWVIASGNNLLADIDSPTGIDIAVSEVVRISNLRLVRFNADRFEIAHQAVSGAELASVCIETPYPDGGSSI